MLALLTNVDLQGTDRDEAKELDRTMVRARALPSMKAAPGRCAAVVGVDPALLANAHGPAHAPAPALLPPHNRFFLRKEIFKVSAFPLAPFGPPALLSCP